MLPKIMSTNASRHDSTISMRIVSAILLISLCTSCSTRINVKPEAQARLTKKHYVSYDGDHFGYRKSVPDTVHTVIIGVHGISGHSGDYDNLTKHLQSNHKGVAIYAAETRGQGLDPNKKRIGDIRNPHIWHKDLYTFTTLIRKKHPQARIIWLGESMGSLIILHAYHNTPQGFKKPDALILASPIIEISDKVAPWQFITMRMAAAIFPKLRISLETLAPNQQPIVTKDNIHKQQAPKNAWYVPRYTLRLLLTLGKMADQMKALASRTHCPVLILHGGQDIFTPKEKIDLFYASFPQKTSTTYHHYKESFHLLMYDHQRKKIFQDISVWLKKYH